MKGGRREKGDLNSINTDIVFVQNKKIFVIDQALHSDILFDNFIKFMLAIKFRKYVKSFKIWCDFLFCLKILTRLISLISMYDVCLKCDNMLEII